MNTRALHAYLLLLPALVLLAAFTHWPALATVIDSFLSNPKPNRPSVWVGMDNYLTMVEDPIFWRALRNNLWFALGTIPLSIGLALLMALWVNERLPGRGFLRLAYFTPTVLPMIAVANIWLFFYTPTYGLLEQVGSLFGLSQGGIEALAQLLLGVCRLHGPPQCLGEGLRLEQRVPGLVRHMLPGAAGGRARGC